MGPVTAAAQTIRGWTDERSGEGGAGAVFGLENSLGQNLGLELLSYQGCAGSGEPVSIPKLQRVESSIPPSPATLDATEDDAVLPDDTSERSEKNPSGTSRTQPASVEDLTAIRPGKEHAERYHDFAFRALKWVFDPFLRKFRKRQRTHGGRKRIDVWAENVAPQGFFHRLTSTHSIKCACVFFECKNYSSDLKNPEFDQLTGRFGRNKGEFGILLCRKVRNRTKMIMRCKDVVNDGRGYVMVFTDDDLTALIEWKHKGDVEGIDKYLSDRLWEILNS